MKFDFDEWAKLAMNNPEAFEERRQKILQQAIDSAAPNTRKRIQGLQWKIDQLRAQATNPMSSCLKISEMMWDSVVGNNGLLDNMQQIKNPEQGIPDKPKTSATIIDLQDSRNREKT